MATQGVCPECSQRGKHKGTYKSRYGFGYRRYQCDSGHKWREGLDGNVIEVKRGRLPFLEEMKLLKVEIDSLECGAQRT